MGSNIDYSASLEKCEWADSKLHDLHSKLLRWFHESDRSIVTKEDGDVLHVVAQLSLPIPKTVAMETVEIAGHLRSALDKLLVAVVESNGRGSSGVGFPFGGMGEDGKAEPFPSARQDRLKKKLTPEQWALILAQKPYPGGNDALWALNEIANQDKHRKDLVAVGTFGRPRQIRAIGHDERATYVLSVGTPDPVPSCCDQKRECIMFSLGIGEGTSLPEIKIEPPITTSVVFGNVRGLTGKDVVGTLHKQLTLTQRIIELFKSPL